MHANNWCMWSAFSQDVWRLYVNEKPAITACDGICYVKNILPYYLWWRMPSAEILTKVRENIKAKDKNRNDTERIILLIECKKAHGSKRPMRKYIWQINYYLFTWNLFQPSFRYATTCSAAAMPALMLASNVWAPIFLGVKNTRSPNFSFIASAASGFTSAM